jgi:hypothetical protein
MATEIDTPIFSDAAFTFESGDVEITALYNGEVFKGCVVSGAMALASPVWRKFIFPPWYTQEGQGGMPTTIPKDDGQGGHRRSASPASKNNNGQKPPVVSLNFCDDDSVALLILLRLVHFKTKDTPTKLPYELLLNIAILVDKYDCIDLVRPWVSSWFLSVEMDSKVQGHVGWLFIAWVFGREKVFTDLATTLVREVALGPGLIPLTSSGGAFPEPMPPGILENILAIRLEVIEKLFDLPYSQVTRFENNSNVLCQQGSNPACDAIIYGSLLRSLQRVDLWPRKDPKVLRTSVNDLAIVIRALKVHILPPNSHNNSYDYHNHYNR